MAVAAVVVVIAVVAVAAVEVVAEVVLSMATPALLDVPSILPPILRDYEKRQKNSRVLSENWVYCV